MTHDTTQPTAAAEPAPDAPAEQRQMQPGETMIQIGPEGMQITALPQPLPLVFRANQELSRHIVADYLHEDLPFWDTLVKMRIEELRTRKEHLTLVTDPATVKRIGKSKAGKA